MASPNTKALRQEQAELRRETIRDVTIVRNPFPNRETRRQMVSKTARKLQKRIEAQRKQKLPIKK